METVAGKKIIYLYRILEQATEKTGVQIAFATENGRTKSKDADSTETKDGPVRTPGASESEITSTSILAKGDETIDELEAAMDGDKLIEIWEANLAEPVEGEDHKYKGRYFQGYLTELERTSNAEDMVELSLTFGVNGTGKTGDVTVTDDQKEQADYVFADTTKKTAA